MQVSQPKLPMPQVYTDHYLNPFLLKSRVDLHIYYISVLKIFRSSNPLELYRGVKGILVAKEYLKI